LRANPEFTRILIVTRFDIETPEQPTEELNVHFQAVGSYQLGMGYTAGSSSEQAGSGCRNRTATCWSRR
jgi:hypothetical protein